jgi:regulator of protease activity HflC (stomatin/prohibitin superfamily)
MKLTRLYANQVGLVLRGCHFVGVRIEGWHLLWPGERLIAYERTGAFSAPCEMDLLLEDRLFRELIHLVEVREQELCLAYKDGLFDAVLLPGKHLFWRSAVAYEFRMIDTSVAEVGERIERRLLERPELKRHILTYVIAPYEEGLLLIDGQYERKLGPGTYRFWRNGQKVEVLTADKRTQQMEVSGQEILTKDKAALRVNFYLQYRITDAERAMLQTNHPNKQLYLAVQLLLREYIGTLTLDELLERKAGVQEFVSQHISERATELGMQVLNSGIRDLILPGEVREIMNQVLVAEKEVQARVILRREENAATRSLLNTAKLLQDNEMLLRLKEMEYVEKIADKVNTISLSGGGQVLEQLQELFLKGKE